MRIFEQAFFLEDYKNLIEKGFEETKFCDLKISLGDLLSKNGSMASGNDVVYYNKQLGLLLVPQPAVTIR